jgi:hypothetical protein
MVHSCVLEVSTRAPKILPQPPTGQQAPHGSEKGYENANKYAEIMMR